MLLVKLPIPLLLLVKLFAVVGLGLVLQQMPRWVTTVPPSEVILPPDIAVSPVMLIIEFVSTVGRVNVVKLYVIPYAVPASFVAYARTK